MFIRCWLHVLLFNSAQQAFTTSWTKPKSWQADKLGSATKMCVYCIELLPLQDGWASLSSVGFHGIHTHTYAHSYKCTFTQSWQDWDICFYFSVTEAAAAAAAEQQACAVRVGGTQPGQPWWPHMCALKAIPGYLICVLTSFGVKKARPKRKQQHPFRKKLNIQKKHFIIVHR